MIRKNIIIVILFFFIICPSAFESSSVLAFEQKPYKQNSLSLEEITRNYIVLRHIQYSFTLRNTTNRVIKKAEFWTYAPVKLTSTQFCLNIKSSHKFKIIPDDSGNQILYFTFSNFPPFGTKIVTIRADLFFSGKSNPIEVRDLGPFLRPEKNMESDNPEITEFAMQFKELTPLKTAEKIFKWVSTNIKYIGYLKNDRGALYALKTRQGDCTEFMALFTALSRANNIPTRGIGGYVYGENQILKPMDYHNWAEFYNNGMWINADPANKVFADKKANYIAMRIIGDPKNNPMGSFHRFRFRGNGLSVKWGS